jgi:hypothetical protein
VWLFVLAHIGGQGNLLGIVILLFSILFEGILINQGTVPGWLSMLKYFRSVLEITSPFRCVRWWQMIVMLCSPQTAFQFRQLFV